jgi:GAF domain-containing protein
MTVSALRVFTRQVHFIEDGATVVERAVEVVQGTTGAAWVGAYTATADGSLMLALRAERASVDAPEDSVLAGTLALPFVAGGKVTGLLAVGAPRRPYASDYRETLQAVATNVGLALEVLQVRGLRAQLEEWRERTEWAEQELATLHRLFDRVRSGSHEAQPH